MCIRDRLFLVLRRRLGGLEEGALAWSAARAAAATWLMIVVVAGFMVWARGWYELADRRGVRYLVELAAGVPAGTLTFLAAAWLAGAQELRSVPLVPRRWRRRAGAYG